MSGMAKAMLVDGRLRYPAQIDNHGSFDFLNMLLIREGLR